MKCLFATSYLFMSPHQNQQAQAMKTYEELKQHFMLLIRSNSVRYMAFMKSEDFFPKRRFSVKISMGQQ